MGSSKSKTILLRAPRPAMPITSLTCTSRQARTQRVQWMQASRFTAIAVWLRSGAGDCRAGKRLVVRSMLSAQSQSSQDGSWLDSTGG